MNIAKYKKTTRGFSLVEVIVASALMSLFFGGLMSGVQLMISMIGHSKAEAGARSLAVSKMEYIRSLDYDSVGTVSGIPSGNIPQASTTTLNNIAYTERVLIQYLDREEDGFGENDDNGLTEDSKRIKIEYTWNIRGENDSLVIISDVIPRGIETTSGGGTLLINVFDSSVQPVVGADVHVFNNSVATDTIDVIVTTNANGIANFPGAPARGGYQITVTKDGYSTDQTYSATPENPNPNPSHVSVSVGTVSTTYFSIDLLSDLTLRAISTPVKGVFSDSFSDSSQLSTSTDIAIVGGSLVLAGGGTYEETGTAFSVASEPSSITSWESIDFNGVSAESNDYRVRVYSAQIVGSSTVYTLIPDSALTSNSVGFISGPVDITSIDSTTYPSLALGVTLTTTDSSVTPELQDWSITHVESESPVVGATFSVVSSKIIGTNDGQPVPKYSSSVTTNGSGEVVLSNIEWDAYDITIDGDIEGYDIAESYAAIPYAVSPNTDDTLTLVLQPHSQYSLRVTVVDTLGDVITGAGVHLYNGIFDETFETSIYGQVFFDTVSSATDYSLDVTATGYDDDTQSNISVIDNTQIQVVMALEGTGDSETSTSTPPTSSNYLPGYTSRVPISIAGPSLFGNVSNFPVYLNLDDLPGSFFNSVQADGDDIRLTEEDGVSELPFELVSIDTSGGTGQLYFKAPSLLISTTTNFYLYFGNSTSTSYSTSASYGRDNVWTESYIAVYHLEESQSGTGNASVYVDSTGNGYNGNDYVAATGKIGKLGSGQEFDNANTDYITLPYQILNGATNVTTSMWFRSSTATIHSLISGANYSEANEYLLWLRGDTSNVELFSHGEPREVYGVSSLYDNAWRMITAVLDDSANQARLYINGAEDNQSPSSANVSALNISSGGLMIGQDQDSVGGGFQSNQELDGYIDEVRMSGVVRSSGWIANEYSNQNSPTSFYTIGTIESE